MQKVVNAFEIVLLTTAMLAGTILVIVPAISPMYIDFGNPNEVGWTQNEEGEEVAEANFDVSPQGMLSHFYETVNSPVRPSFWQIPLISFGLGILFLLGITRIKRSAKEAGLWTAFVIASQLVIWLFCVGLALFTILSFDSTAELQGVVDDPELAKEAGKIADSLLVNHSIGIMLLSFLVLIVYDIIAFLTAAGLLTGREESVKYLKRQVERKVGLALGDGTFLIFRGSSVETVTLSFEIKWLPVPVPIIRRETISRVSFDDFFDLLLGDSKETAFEELHRRLMDSYEARFGGTGAKALQALAEELRSKLQEGLDHEVSRLRAEDSAQSFESARALLQRNSDQTLARFQQDMAAGIRGVVQTTFAVFREHLITHIQGPAIGARTFVLQDREIETFPEGTRFILSYGEHTSVVVEQKPQVRTVLFYSGFIRNDEISTHDIESQTESIGRSRGLRLAFPYVIFLTRLWRGRYDGLHVFYSKKPLASLDESVFLPNLPNIDNSSVCLGIGDLQGTTIRAKVEEIIAHFWQSQFNNDYRSGYEAAAMRDERLQNVIRWQEESQKDPNFVLDVGWIDTMTTIRQLIQRSAERADVSTDLRALINVVLNESGDQTEETVRQYLSNIPARGRYPKRVTETLSSHLSDLSEHLLGQIVAYFQELAKDADPNLQQLFNQSVTETVGQVLTGEFEQVPIRREVSTHDLLAKMGRR